MEKCSTRCRLKADAERVRNSACRYLFAGDEDGDFNTQTSRLVSEPGNCTEDLCSSNLGGKVAGHMSVRDLDNTCGRDTAVFGRCWTPSLSVVRERKLGNT